MFDGLSRKLLSIFDRVGHRGILTEDIINSTVREIRVSLLEADVSLSVVKDFISDLKTKLKNKSVVKTVTPEQTIIKIVYDELVKFLGEGDQEFLYTSIMMVGLQGSGKTTSTAKLANLLQKKFNKKCLLVSLDTYRPAAIDQLRILAQSNNIDFFDDFTSHDTPIEIAKKANANKNEYDVIIYDTAGRTYLDNTMMQELQQVKFNTNPRDILLVIDSMMGQSVLNTARSFNEQLALTGLVLTRVDGDARGGATLSAKAVTGCQIKFIGIGEKIADIEIFRPERIASRILDKGDIVSLVEKAIESDVASDVATVKVGREFDLNGMETYLKQIEKIGGISGIMKFIPGIKKMQSKLIESGVTDKKIAQQVAIIRSMTTKERKNPKILNASRRKRIAFGCGQDVSAVNRLINQFEQIKSLMVNISDNGFMKNILRNSLFK